MQTFITVLHVFTCILLVLLVLVQSGKGAEISASFGGSSQTVFGSSGGANFFSRFTSAMAAIFMITSVVLTIMGGRNRKSVFEGAVPAAPAQTAPGTNPVDPLSGQTTPGTSGLPPQNTKTPANTAPAAPAQHK
jgi:preprotein translocase subunit SecG